MSCLLNKFDTIKKDYPEELKQSLALPLLHTIQNDKGFIEESDMIMVAEYLSVPLKQIQEVVSWYTMFFTKPQGRHVVKVCRNIACSMMGADRMITHLEKKLGIKEGQTTKDGKYTLATVECLASCGTGPMMQINRTYHENLTTDKIDHIISELS